MAIAWLPQHLGADPLGRLAVDDRVDPGRGDAERDREVDVAAAEGVDEGVDRAVGGGADALLLPLAVGDRDDPAVAQPGVVALAGEADHAGAGTPGELDGDAADAARGGGDDHGVALPRLDRLHAGEPGHAGDEERAGDLPGDRGRLGGDVRGRSGDQLGVRGALLGPAQDLVADAEAVGAGADRGDHAGEVRALAGGEGGGPSLVQPALADRDLAGVDPRRADRDQHLAGAGDRVLDLAHLEHLRAAVAVEPDRPHVRSRCTAPKPTEAPARAGPAAASRPAPASGRAPRRRSA